MATLVLTGVGAVVSGTLLPGGVTFLGATISGAALGATEGGVVGGVIDQTLLAPSQHHRFDQEGPRLNSVGMTSSTEGAAITRLQGHSRLPGQVIWAMRFEEENRIVRHKERSGTSAPRAGGDEPPVHSAS